MTPEQQAAATELRMILGSGSTPLSPQDAVAFQAAWDKLANATAVLAPRAGGAPGVADRAAPALVYRPEATTACVYGTVGCDACRECICHHCFDHDGIDTCPKCPTLDDGAPRARDRHPRGHRGGAR